MISIINSNFTRIRKSKIFWLGAIVVLLISGFCIFSMYNNYLSEIKYAKEVQNSNIYENLGCFYWFTGVIVAVLMVVCPILIGADNDSGIIRNMIVSGVSRTSIFFANIITAICMALVYIMVWTIPMVTVGMSLVGSVNTWENIISETSIGIVVVLVFTILYASITMLLKSNKIATIVCIVITALFTLSAILLENIFHEAQTLKWFINYAKEEYDATLTEKNSLIELSKKRINSNLLSDLQKKSEEDIINYNKECLQDYDTYDEFLEHNTPPSSIKRLKEKKDMGIWVTLFRINLVNQGWYYMQWKEDSYIYDIDGNRHDATNDEKEEREPFKEEAVASPEYMASIDAIEYRSYIELSENNQIKDYDYAVDDEKMDKEEEKAKKAYLEIEKKLFKDESYKKLVEKMVESQNKNNKLNEKREPYNIFDVKEALSFDIIFCIIVILGTYTIFLKKNID